MLPIEAFVAIAVVAAAAFGWRAFSQPAFGALAVMFTIPLQKTSGSEGLLARFAITDIFTALTVAGTVVALARGRDTGWKDLRIPTQFLFGIALFLPIVAISFFVTETPSRSIVETFAYVVNMALAAIVAFYVRSRRDLERCLDVWERAVVLVVIGALIAVVLLFLGNPHTLLTNGPKVTSTFKKSGQLAAYLIGSLPILWFNLRYRTTTRGARVARRSLLAGTLIAIVATGSRTGFLVGGALAVVLFVGPLVASLRGRTALKLASLAFGVMLVVPLIRSVVDSLPFSFQRAASIVLMSSDEDGGGSLEGLSQSRSYQMQGFEIAASTRPWTGVGVGDFYTHNTALVPGAWKSHEVHNTYLGVWSETGIVGAVALCLFLFGATQASWQTIAQGRGALGILGLALLLSALSFYGYGLSHFGLRMRHMWGILGLILAAWNVVRMERAARESWS